jgi:hypothetical protein
MCLQSLWEQRVLRPTWISGDLYGLLLKAHKPCLRNAFGQLEAPGGAALTWGFWKLVAD